MDHECHQIIKDLENYFVQMGYFSSQKKERGGGGREVTTKKKTPEKSTVLHYVSFIAVRPIAFPGKTNYTTTVTPVLQSIVESQILVLWRRIYSHKPFVVLLTVAQSF